VKEKFIHFFKKEIVLCISALCALLSMTAVPPSFAYLAYIDFRVLGLLWCLMAVVAGFRSCGVFDWLTLRILNITGNGRILAALLVLLPFFCSMAVTNDVALLTFVPFTILLLGQLGQPRALIPLLVLQTMAANLGSMATPVGNPQNLYLYARYDLSAGQFFSTILPFVFVSLLCLVAAALPILPRALSISNSSSLPPLPGKKLGIFGFLFLLCLLSVFRLLDWRILTAIILLYLLFLDRSLLRAPDYGLLITFVCFFIFSGNLGEITAVRSLLQALLAQNALLTAVLTSQIISNVPAAVLLSNFTSNWAGLLLGTNIGGLGTPVASLASLISLKLYLQTPHANIGRYLTLFTLANAAGLFLLLILSGFLH